MPPSSPELFRPDVSVLDPVPSRNPLPASTDSSTRFAWVPDRLREALCRKPAKSARDGLRQRAWRGYQSGPPRTVVNDQNLLNEQGSAVVEFVFLALLLMVPLVYFVITVGQIQGGSFAVVGAADQAAKVYVAQPDASTAQAAAEQAVALALSDFGHETGRASLATTCNPADCQAAGTTVTVTVSLNVPLPLVPFAEGLTATTVEASSTQLVGRYR